MKKYLFFLCFFVSQLSISQDSLSVDKKYISALLYLKTDENFTKNILLFKNRWLRKDKNKCVKFNLAKEIMYMPLSDFSGKIDYTKYNFDKNLVDNDSLYRSKYYFEPINYPFNELIPLNKSKLRLTFSKGIANYLLAEITINLYGEYYYKRGPAIQLLFIFNEVGMVEKLYTTACYYN